MPRSLVIGRAKDVAVAGHSRNKTPKIRIALIVCGSIVFLKLTL